MATFTGRWAHTADTDELIMLLRRSLWRFSKPLISISVKLLLPTAGSSYFYIFTIMHRLDSSLLRPRACDLKIDLGTAS